MPAVLQHLLRSWSADRAAWLVSIAASVIGYLAILAAVPIYVARLPPDYFTRPAQRSGGPFRIVRAVVGGAIVAAGVAMLFLPGPGVLTMLAGLLIMGGDLATRALGRLLARPGVLAAVNAMRAKRGRPPLEAPPMRRTDGG